MPRASFVDLWTSWNHLHLEINAHKSKVKGRHCSINILVTFGKQFQHNGFMGTDDLSVQNGFLMTSWKQLVKKHNELIMCLWVAERRSRGRESDESILVPMC